MALPLPWYSDVHLSVTGSTGILARDAQEWTTGMASLGATFGVEAGPAWVGPTVEARLPFRWHAAEDQGR